MRKLVTGSGFRRAAVVLLAVSAAGAGCRETSPSIPPQPPNAILRLPAKGGRAAVGAVEVAGETRDALTRSAAWDVSIPGDSRLTFGVGTSWSKSGDPPGWARFAISFGGVEIASETLNPRVPGDWKDVTVEMPGPAHPGVLTIDLRLTDKDRREIAWPEGLTLAVSDPVIHDVRSYGRAKGAILISIDTLRRDHVGLYGYSKPTTPALDALAKAGVVADDAVSVSSWTLPSHLSMLTSVLPGVHGGTNGERGFNRASPTLPAILKERGFATHAVTSHLYVSHAYGVDHGFDSMNFRQDRKAVNVANHAMDLVDRFGDRPFFLFLHLYDPHWHYDPPKETLALFEPKPYAGRLTGNLKDFQTKRPEDLAPGDLEHLLALYDGEIRSVDDQIARLVDHLKARGVFESTLLFVTSDHGEEFLEHGSWEHQKTLYEEVVRIPMFAAGGGVSARREPLPATLLDVAPSILDFVGVERPASMSGRSLLRPLTESREQYGETEHTVDRKPILFLRAGARSWKTILPAAGPAGAGSWFDLATDAREMTSVPPRDDVRRQIESRARALFAESRRGAKPSSGVSLTAEQKETLRALGYIR